MAASEKGAQDRSRRFVPFLRCERVDGLDRPRIKVRGDHYTCWSRSSPASLKLLNRKLPSKSRAFWLL
jgi:hypothetical protein